MATPDNATTQISPEAFARLPPEAQNTILYSSLLHILERVVHVERRLSYYDKLRMLGIGGLSVATGVGGVIVWIVNFLAAHGGSK